MSCAGVAEWGERCRVRVWLSGVMHAGVTCMA